MAWCAKGKSSRDFEGGYFLSDSDADEESSDDCSPPLDSELDSELDPGEAKLRREPEEDDSPPEQDEEDVIQPKRRRVEDSLSGRGNTDSGQGRSKVTPPPSKSRATLSLSAGHTPVLRRNVFSQPKTLNMKGVDEKESLLASLGNITNMLGAVIERLDKTESKLESVERKINTPSSSSAGSGTDNRRKVPPIVRVSFLRVH